MSDRRGHRHQGGGVAGPFHRYAVSSFDLSMSKSSGKFEEDYHHHSDLETEDDEEEDSLGYQHGARSNFILRKSRSLYYNGGVDGYDDHDDDDDQRHAHHPNHNSRSHHSPLGLTSPPSLKPVECRLLERAKVSTQSPIKVSPKIVDLSFHSFSDHSPLSTPRSVRALLSSNTSSPSSSTLCHHTSSMLNGNLTLSSSSGCSTQSSVSSSASLGTLSRNGYGYQVNHSRHQNQRSSLREAAQNFRDFVQQYEQSLIECLSSVEDSGAAGGGNTAEGAGNEEHSVKRELEPTAISEQEDQAREQVSEVTAIRRNESSASSPLCRQSLRLQLEKVRRLRDQYETGFRCTEAIEKIEKLSRSRADCAREWRANQRLLASIEQQLEKLIGIFRIRVDDLEGWARICPRDQYEIEFRHGKQRQVLRVRIGKALERTWDHDRCEVTFRGALKPTIVCRMREVKSRWNLWSKRNTTLGVTSISMSELLAAVAKNCPILLDANASGSLKLRIFCTWQPNSNSGEIMLSPPTTPISPLSLDHRNRSATMDERQLDKKKKLETSSNSLRVDSCHLPRIGINKELARSLLHLPTFYEYRQEMVNNKSDNHDKTSDLSEENEDDRRDSAHSTSSNQTDNREQSEEAEMDGKSEEPRAYLSQLSISVTPDSSRSVSPYPLVHRIENPIKGSRQGTIERMLHNLQSALEDYRGQFIELAMLTITVNRLVEYFDQTNPERVEESSSDSGQRSKTPDSEREIEHALAEFDFLDSPDEDSDDDGSEGKIIASFENRAIGRAGRVPGAGNEESEEDEEPALADTFVPPQPQHSTQQNCESSRHVWSSILLLHLSSALDHLNQVGSWILKARETAALCRLHIDTFACEQIYEILTKGTDKHQPLGNDVRLHELWDQLSTPSGNSQRWVLSTRQLSSHLAQMMSDQIGSSSPLTDSEDDEDIYRNAAHWLVGLIVPPGHNKLTIFDLRAFFELDLWRKNSGPNQHLEPISLKALFQIALDLIRLVKLKTRKVSLYRVEQILFDRFNVNCHWIPSELSLTLISLLYESHSQLEKGRHRKSGLTTSEVKKCDRLRELSKTITNWFIWILEEGRFEIREHILSGLESSSLLTRRASCYGMMFLFKLLKRIDDDQHRRRSEVNSGSGESRSNLNQISLFYGQEMDCLLYVSIEDPDSRVREEARQALKCLGAFGQMRLNQLERSRMGFAMSNGSDSCKTSTKSYFSPTNQLSSFYFGRSMPNLNLR